MAKIISVDVNESIELPLDQPLGTVVKSLGISRPGNKAGKPDVEQTATVVFDVTLRQLLEIASRPIVIRYQDTVRRGDANAPEWYIDEVTLYASALAEKESLLSRKARTARDLKSMNVSERLSIIKATCDEDVFLLACKKAGIDPSEIE